MSNFSRGRCSQKSFWCCCHFEWQAFSFCNGKFLCEPCGGVSVDYWRVSLFLFEMVYRRRVLEPAFCITSGSGKGDLIALVLDGPSQLRFGAGNRGWSCSFMLPRGSSKSGFFEKCGPLLCFYFFGGGASAQGCFNSEIMVLGFVSFMLASAQGSFNSDICN